MVPEVMFRSAPAKRLSAVAESAATGADGFLPGFDVRAFSPEGQPAISYEANGDLRYALLPRGLHTEQ